MKNLAFIMAQAEVIKLVKIFGIEGTEQKIKEVYGDMPNKICETMLEAWRSIYKDYL